jgi:probable F420-dependent oxidoreductase
VKFTVQYPLAVPGYSAEFLRPDAMIRFAQAAEQAGFSALAVTDHPVPSDKWIRAGGHDSLDMPTALGFCAAVTTTIRLMPYALVLPYRNPFLTAKAIATLDVLSAGRVTLAVAVGYLRSEFLALGIDFEQRNELFDEAVQVMRGVWSERAYAFEGRDFTALGQTALPVPVQAGGVPIWIGGNSRRARERAAATGQGWAPLLIDAERAATVRTAPMPTVADFAEAVVEMRSLCVAAGRDPDEVEVQIEGPDSADLVHGRHLDAHRARLRELADAGAGWFVTDTPAGSVDEAVDALHRYGDQVISRAG